MRPFNSSESLLIIMKTPEDCSNQLIYRVGAEVVLCPECSHPVKLHINWSQGDPFWVHGPYFLWPSLKLNGWALQTFTFACQSGNTYRSTSVKLKNIFLIWWLHISVFIRTKYTDRNRQNMEPVIAWGWQSTVWWLKCHDEQRVPAEDGLMTLLHFTGLTVTSLNWSRW